MATIDSTRPCPGVEILHDLHSAIAGAAALMKSDRPASGEASFAENLLDQALDRARTLREVLRG